MNREDFLLHVRLYSREHPNMRYGQCVYTVAMTFGPWITGPLTGTDLDPYYVDVRADAFIDVFLERLNAR